MAWNPFRKEDDATPNKPDQSKSEADALIEKLGAAMDERLKPLNDRVGALQAKWDEIEKLASAPVETAEKKPPADPASDPERWKAENLTPLAVQSVLTNARLTEREVLDELSPAWAEYVPRIRDCYAQTPIQRKAQADYADYCRNLVRMVVGDAAMKAGLRYNPDSKKFFLEDAVSKTGEPSPFSDPSLNWVDPNNPRHVLTAGDQLARLGIDPKELAESMKRGIV